MTRVDGSPELRVGDDVELIRDNRAEHSPADLVWVHRFHASGLAGYVGRWGVGVGKTANRA